MGPICQLLAGNRPSAELELVLENPTSQMGIHTTPTCPSWAFCPDETWRVVNVKLREGQSLRGFARGRAEHDLELQTFDGLEIGRPVLAGHRVAENQLPIGDNGKLQKSPRMILSA